MKRPLDLPHDVLLRRLSKILQIPSQEIGVAGIKDRRAVTRQYVSVPIECNSNVEQLNSDDLHILRATPHTNKLRTGHVRGNRFSTIVRDIEEDAATRAAAIVGVIQNRGFPNYYGEQRFGHDGETLSLGLDLLSCRAQPKDIPYQKRRFLLRLALSAVQSELFNRALATRMRDGLLQTVLDGDIMEVTESGGKFVVEDVSREQSRLHEREVSITGPMFGLKMLSPRGLPMERETNLMTESGLSLDAFGKFPQLLSGARRAYTAHPINLSASPVQNDKETVIQLDFTLQSGVYATMLMREIMKNSGSLRNKDQPE